jgi:hypothetical protein
MANLRIGISSDFVLNNSRIGIGTINPQAPLDVRGAIKGDFNVSGASTLSVYSGFTPEFQNISIASTIGFSTSGVGTFIQVTESETGYLILSGEYNTVSEDIIVDEGRIFEVSIGSTFVPGTLESISVQSHFSVPNGGTLERNANPVEGMVRFNDDLNTLEFWNGFEWRQFTVTGASGRGVFGGGVDSSGTNLSVIEYINISTLSNSYYFGEMTVARRNFSTAASETRGLFWGSNSPSTNLIEYITIASEGNAINFGQLSIAGAGTGCSSSTRGIFAGGTTTTNTIEYITIHTLGNGLDFGDLIFSVDIPYATASPTRGLIAGGRTPSGATSLINLITISSTGNAITFGDLTRQTTFGSSCSSSTRGVFGGGSVPGGSGTNIIDYVTIATIGNAIDFGDLTTQRKNFGSSSNQVRGVFAGGYDPVLVNVIDYITISSTGNAQDFGDLSTLRRSAYSLSDSHGGLGGF